MVLTARFPGTWLVRKKGENGRMRGCSGALVGKDEMRTSVVSARPRVLIQNEVLPTIHYQ